MTVETATYISSLDPTYPTGAETNDSAEGDNHIRLIKSTVKATFPAVTGAVTASHTELNILKGVTATAAELSKMAGVTVTTAEINYLSGVTSAIQTQLNGKMTAAPTVSVKTDNFDAAASYHYILRTASSKTATLPGSPSAGDFVWFTNHSGGNWTAGRNSLKIMGATSDLTMATGNHYQLLYIDATTGWAVLKAS